MHCPIDIDVLMPLRIKCCKKFLYIYRKKTIVDHTYNTKYAISAYHHWCCEFASRSGRGVQHYVIKFVSDRSVIFSGSSGFLHKKNWPPRQNWNIVESGVTHHQTNKQTIQSQIVIFPTIFSNVKSITMVYYLCSRLHNIFNILYHTCIICNKCHITTYSMSILLLEYETFNWYWLVLIIHFFQAKNKLINTFLNHDPIENPSVPL